MNGTILLKSKQSKIIIALKDQTQNWYISTLAKASGTTYVHTCNFINQCESLGIIQCEKHGKIKLVKLTEKGAKIAENLSSLLGMITVPPQQQPEQKG